MLITTLGTNETPLNVWRREIITAYSKNRMQHTWYVHNVHTVTAMLWSVLKYFEIGRRNVRHRDRGDTAWLHQHCKYFHPALERHQHSLYAGAGWKKTEKKSKNGQFPVALIRIDMLGRHIRPTPTAYLRVTFMTFFQNTDLNLYFWADHEPTPISWWRTYLSNVPLLLHKAVKETASKLHCYISTPQSIISTCSIRFSQETANISLRSINPFLLRNRASHNLNIAHVGSRPS